MKWLVSLTNSNLFSFQINLGIYAKDNNTEMSVLVDRSVGGSSIVDGQLELMVHRFVLYFTLDLHFYSA